MLGKGYLCAVVTQDAANWPTPAVMDTTGGSYKTEWKDGRAVSYHNHAQENPVAYGAKLSDAVKYGPVDPENPSTLGSRQGSSEEVWPTPTAVNRVRNEETMEKCLKFRQGNGQTSVPLYLEEKVNLVEKKSWATPQQRDFKDAEPLVKWTERAEEQKAKGVNLHLPLPSQVMHTEEKQWATPQASDPEHSGPNQRSSSGRPALPAQAMQWATPRSGKTTDENPETWALRQANGDVATMPLTAQVKCWGTPTARNHKSGRGNEEREYKELTPMVERTQSGKLNPRWVETLMGLPVGWTMPSCTRPVTIELTSFDSSATELCQQQQNEHSEF